MIILTRVIRLAMTILLLCIGGVTSLLIEEHYIKNVSFNLQLFKKYWMLAPLSILYWVAYKLVARAKQIEYNETRAYHEVKKFWEKQKMNENDEADVRYTIWVRVGQLSRTKPIRMKQAIDYVPPLSKEKEGLFRHNHRTRRSIVVSRVVGRNREEPIGVLGKCVIESIRQGNMIISLGIIPKEVDFLTHMTEQFRFKQRDAQKQLQDRKSFIAGSLMSRTGELLGIFYGDSRNPYAFNGEVADEIEEFLPELSESLLIDNKERTL